MASLQFEYKIMPYSSAQYAKTDALPLPHSETDLLSKGGDVDTKELGTEHKAEEEFEKSVRQIYYYQQSYFRDNQVPGGIFPDFHFNDERESSEQFCINLRWKNAQKVYG